MMQVLDTAQQCNHQLENLPQQSTEKHGPIMRNAVHNSVKRIENDIEKF